MTTETVPVMPVDRVRAFEVLTKECGPRQPVLPDLSRGDLLQVSQAFIVRQVLKLQQATLKARVNGLGSGTCLFLGIMSLDKEGGARHKQMDQEHVLEQVRPRFIDLTKSSYITEGGPPAWEGEHPERRQHFQELQDSLRVARVSRASSYM